MALIAVSRSRLHKPPQPCGTEPPPYRQIENLRLDKTPWKFPPVHVAKHTLDKGEDCKEHRYGEP